MVAAAATTALAVGTAIVYYAALSKLWNPSPLRAMLGALDVPAPQVRVFAAAIVGIELTAVGLVVAGVSRALIAATFVTLGAAFAVAGIRALSLNRVIPCACFGRPGAALGWRQVAASPLWVVVAFAATEMPSFSPSCRGLALTAGTAALAGLRSVDGLRGWRDARNDRRALAGA